MESKRWAVLLMAAVLGGGGAAAVGSCGGEDRGSVESENLGTDTGGAATGTAPTETTETTETGPSQP